MGEAYTPGLLITESIIVSKRRILPIPGEVTVKTGDIVTPDTIIARSHMPGNVEVINLKDKLNLSGTGQISKILIKKVGDTVKEGEIIASKPTLFGLSKENLKSPASGTVEYISTLSGQLHIRNPPVPIDVKAYIPGKIVEILPNEGVVIETLASFIQGIFGCGRETHGEIAIVANSPDEILTEDKILPHHSGKIIVGGSLVTIEAIKKANAESVKGIIVGGIKDKDLIDCLGYEIGVAITGEEDINTTLIVTEGFGKMNMSGRTFDLLKKCVGKEACINGATQIRAGVIRPEVIIPIESGLVESIRPDVGMRLKLGTTVRIISGPDFGLFGKVVGLEAQLQKIETESKVIVVKIQLEDGREVSLPRANVEIVQY